MARATAAAPAEPLEEQLWKAADKLRKNIDAAEYKHVVLGLWRCNDAKADRPIGVGLRRWFQPAQPVSHGPAIPAFRRAADCDDTVGTIELVTFCRDHQDRR